MSGASASAGTAAGSGASAGSMSGAGTAASGSGSGNAAGSGTAGSTTGSSAGGTTTGSGTGGGATGAGAGGAGSSSGGTAGPGAGGTGSAGGTPAPSPQAVSSAAANYDSRSGVPPAAFVNVTGLGASPADGTSTITLAPDGQSARLVVRTGGVAFDRTFPIGAFAGLPTAEGAGILELTDLDASRFGVWATRTGPTTFEVGAVAFGAETPVASMPRSGTATYAGTTTGIYTAGATSSRLDGTATLGVDFAQMGLRADFRNLQTASGFRVPDIGGNATISGNGFSGTVDGPVYMSGPLHGRFFGPGAEEAAGVWAVQGKTNGSIAGPMESITAGFGARRQ